MKSASNLIGAFLILLICSGCVPIPIPYYGVKRPGATGVILDAQTKQPIAGATVTMNAGHVIGVPSDVRYLRESDSRRVVACVETTGEGNYNIPPERGLRCWIVPNFLPTYSVLCQLRISHPSYETNEWFFSVIDDQNPFGVLPAKANLSPVYLNPVPK